MSFLSDALRGLKDTGDNGFEGLVRGLLEKWTGQKFSLARSGSQQGLDMGSRANTIVADGKNYSDSSKLDSRSLVGQLVEAAQSFESLELWILATSKEVANQEVERLLRTADDYGVEVLIVDARAAGLGSLDVLCAEYSEMTLEFLKAHGESKGLGEVRAKLDEIRGDPEYSAAKERLSAQLRGTCLGFAATAAKARHHFIESITSIQESRLQYQQDIAIAATGRATIPLPRDALFDQLDSWWLKRGERQAGKQAVALIGEEGTGKTWAAFQWIKRELDRNSQLLVIATTARHLGEIDSIHELLARELSRKSPRDHDFWSSRLQRWLDDDGREPFALVLIDGLNENPSAAWDRLVPSIERCRDKVGLLLTSWKGNWDQEFRTQLGHHVQAIETLGFSREELKTKLVEQDVAIADVSADVQQLLSKPRYFNLALSIWRECGEPFTLTQERLLYEDYKRRYDDGRKTMDDQRFGELICALAKPYMQGQPSYSSVHLESTFGLEKEALAYLLNGSFFEHSGKASEPHQLRREWLTMGLGLLLADTVRVPELSLEEALVRIESWLEPAAAMPIKSEVCGAAFYASLEATYPVSSRRALLLKWIGMRNLERPIEDKLSSYLDDGLEDVLAVAEHVWSQDVNDPLAQEHIARAFKGRLPSIAKHPSFVAAITRWLSFVNQTGQPFDRHHRDDPAGEKLQEEIEARVAQRLEPGKAVDYAGHKFEVIDDAGLLRLARLALFWLSVVPLQPHANAFVRWAISRRLMGRAGEFDEVAWVLRLSIDDIYPVLAPSLTKLSESTDIILRKAASTLLACIGEAPAIELRKAKLADLVPVSYAYRQHQEDPCLSMIAWDREECARCLEREDAPLWKYISDVSKHAVDPSMPEVGTPIKRVEEFLSDLDMGEWRSQFHQTKTDVEMDQVTGVAGRFAPFALAARIREAVSGINERTAVGRRQLLITLDSAVMLCGERERECFDEALERLRTSDELDERADLAECQGTLGQMVHFGADHAASVILSRPVWALDILTIEPWLAPISEKFSSELFSMLRKGGSTQETNRILWVLSTNMLSLEPENRQVLRRLLVSENELTVALVLRAVLMNEDSELSDDVVRLEKAPCLSEHWGAALYARIIAKSANRQHVQDLVRTLSISHLSHIVAIGQPDLQEIEAFAELVGAYWDKAAGVAQDAEELPTILSEDEENEPYRRFRDQPSNAEVVSVDSQSSWGGSQPHAGTLQDVLGVEDEEALEERSRAFREIVNELREKDENALWDCAIEKEAMLRIMDYSSGLIRKWIDEVEFQPRLVERASGFYQSLCDALWDRDAEKALSLWRKLRSMRHTTRFVNRPESSDWISAMPFRRDDPAALVARNELLDSCMDDLSLLEVATIAIANNEFEWMEKQIKELISEPRLARRARGIMLACMSGVSNKELDRTINEAEVSGSWVGDLLVAMRDHKNKFEFAQHWYRTFLREDDNDLAWAAFQLFLRCVDRRAWKMMVLLEDEAQGPHKKQRKKISRSYAQSLRHRIERREREMKGRYLTLKFKKGELLAFCE